MPYSAHLSGLSARVACDQIRARGHVDGDSVDGAGLQIVIRNGVGLIDLEIRKGCGEIGLRILQHICGGGGGLYAYDLALEIGKCLDIGIACNQNALSVVGIGDAPLVIVLTAFLCEAGPDAVTASCVQLHILCVPVKGNRLVAPAQIIADCLAKLNVKAADAAVILQVGIGRIVKVKAVLEGEAAVTGALFGELGTVDVISGEAEIILDVGILLADLIIFAVQTRAFTAPLTVSASSLSPMRKPMA